jgi:adenylyl-sulfate kinase
MVSKCIWLTGLPCAGKTTLARGLEKKLREKGILCLHLDGDEVRKGLNSDLGFSMEHRRENIRRVAELSKILTSRGILTICSFIAPTRAIRQMARTIISSELFVEIFVDTSIGECEHRDIKGMYNKARKGEIPEFTGISSPWEPPLAPSLVIHTNGRSADDCVQELVEFVITTSEHR